MFPAREGNTYIPDLTSIPPAPTIEEVRRDGVIVMTDGVTALVQTTKGMAVSFCTVTLNPDGTIADFVPRPINKYIQVKSRK